MTQAALKKVDWFVVGYGILLTLGAFSFFGVRAGIGTAVGASLATLNWIGFRWAGLRFAATGNRTRVGIFLAFKTLIILGIIVIILRGTPVQPVPFLIGMSALVLGIISRGAVQAIEEGEEALKKED